MSGDRFEEEDDLNNEDQDFVLDDREGGGSHEDNTLEEVEDPAASLDFDDDDDDMFVLDEEPTLEEAMEFGESDGAGTDEAPTTGSKRSEEDLLLEAENDDRQSTSSFDAYLGEPFDDAPDKDWAGDDVSLETVMGFDGDDSSVADESPFEDPADVEDPFALEEVELERIDDDFVLVDEAEDAASDADSEAVGAEEFAGTDAWGALSDAAPDSQAWDAETPVDATAWVESDAEGDPFGDAAVEPAFGAFGAEQGENAEDLTLADADVGQWAVRDHGPDASADGHAHVDPIYGEDDDAAVEGQPVDEFAPVGAAPDYSEYEDSFVETGDPADHQLVAAGSDRARSRSWIAAAAVVIASVIGAVAFIYPEYLGLGPEAPEVHRVVLDRPTVDLSLDPPKPDFPVDPDPVDPDPVDPDPVDPDPVDPDPVDPDPVDPDPVDPDPVDPDPVDPDPVDPDPVDPDPVAVVDPLDPVEIPEPQPRAVADVVIGDNLTVRALPEGEAGNEPPRIGAVVPGEKAYALLYNKAFFIGRVKKIDTSEITLDLESGEVSLAYADLRRLVPLTDSDQVITAEHGFVRLSNEARLFGSIMRTDDDEAVVLKTEQSRISIPREQIHMMGLTTRAGIEVREEVDDEWVQEQARERMESLIRGTRTIEYGEDSRSRLSTPPKSPDGRR